MGVHGVEHELLAYGSKRLQHVDAFTAAVPMLFEVSVQTLLRASIVLADAA